jgi:hypothetical protein
MAACEKRDLFPEKRDLFPDQDGNASHVRRDLLQHPKQFRSEARLHDRKPRHVAPGVGQALHEAISHRIAPTYEYDGD